MGLGGGQENFQSWGSHFLPHPRAEPDHCQIVTVDLPPHDHPRLPAAQPSNSRSGGSPWTFVNSVTCWRLPDPSPRWRIRSRRWQLACWLHLGSCSSWWCSWDSHGGVLQPKPVPHVSRTCVSLSPCRGVQRLRSRSAEKVHAPWSSPSYSSLSFSHQPSHPA